MNLLVTSDFHITSNYPFSTSPNPFKDIFFTTAMKAMFQVVNYAIDNKVDAIIHGGDWFNEEKINAPAYMISRAMLSKLEKVKIPLYINIGNHEIDYKESIPAVICEIMKDYSNVKMPICNQPYTCIPISEAYLYVVPYNGTENFYLTIDKIKKEIIRPAILCIHEDIGGIEFGGAKMRAGVTLDFLQSISNEFLFIVCGHIHHHRIWEKKIITPGSVYSGDFRDKGDTKYFYHVLTDGNRVKEIKSILINNQIYFRDLISIYDAEEFINDCDAQDGDYKNYYIKIHGEMKDMNKFNELKKIMMDKGALNVVHSLVENNSSPDLSGYARPVEMKINDWFVEFLKRNDYEDEEIENLIRFHDKILEI